MENPYLFGMGNSGGRTLAQSSGLGNAKLCQNDEILDSFGGVRRR
jgi:hypothetical protein